MSASANAGTLGESSSELQIGGMTCTSCVSRIKAASSRVPAVIRAGQRQPGDPEGLDVQGMTCASCVARVEKALLDVPGVRGDPALVVDAIDISRRTYAKIKQSLFWAFAYNVLASLLAALGLLSPVFSGAAMAFSSVSVVSNALLLRRWRPAVNAPHSDGLIFVAPTQPV